MPHRTIRSSEQLLPLTPPPSAHTALSMSTPTNTNVQILNCFQKKIIKTGNTLSIDKPTLVLRLVDFRISQVTKKKKNHIIKISYHHNIISFDQPTPPESFFCQVQWFIVVFSYIYRLNYYALPKSSPSNTRDAPEIMMRKCIILIFVLFLSIPFFKL